MKKLVSARPYLLSLIWALVIFVLCATPGKYIPAASWLDLLSFDKLVHAGLFFILCSLLFIGGVRHHKKTFYFVIVFFTCIAYGGLLEIMQARCFSQRSGDWLDFIANSFGCLVSWLMLRKMKLKFNPNGTAAA